MVVQLVTVVSTLLSVAVGAGWLVGSEKRRLSSIKAEAELAQLLPPGEVRAELQARVVEDTWRYVQSRHVVALKRWVNVYRGAAVLIGVAALAAFVTAGVAWSTAPDPTWVKVWQIPILAGELIGWALAVYSLRKGEAVAVGLPDPKARD